MKVKKNIITVYQVIGQNSSFDAKYTESTGLPEASIKASAITEEDWNQQILPSILQEMQALTTQNETIMNTLAESFNQGNPTPLRGQGDNREGYEGNQEGVRGVNLNMKCFTCRERGYYSPACLN